MKLINSIITAALLLCASISSAVTIVNVDGALCAVGDNARCSAPGISVIVTRTATGLDVNWNANTFTTGQASRFVTVFVASDGYNVMGPMTTAFGGNGLLHSTQAVARADAATSGIFGPYSDRVYSERRVTQFTTQTSTITAEITIALLSSNSTSGGDLAIETTPYVCTVNCGPPPSCTPPLTGTYPDCGTCPVNTRGTYPICEVILCAPPAIGTYPDCHVPTCTPPDVGSYPDCHAPTCVLPEIGTFPNCHVPTCADSGQVGTYPACRAPTCADSNQVGNYPACHNPACSDTGLVGTYPACTNPPCTGPSCAPPICTHDCPVVTVPVLDDVKTLVLLSTLLSLLAMLVFVRLHR